MQSYKRREDKNGNVLEEPVKFNDHLMDAMHYGVTGFMAMYGAKYKILKDLTNRGKSDG